MPALLDELLARKVARRRLPEPAIRRLLRVQAGLTQAELGAAVGVARETVSRWETGKRTPQGATLDSYLEALEKLVQIRDAQVLRRPEVIHEMNERRATGGAHQPENAGDPVP
jgi:transcriptional regulator with XRE-family HTH domain